MTVDVIVVMIVSFRIVGVGMIVGVIVAMLCFMLVSFRAVRVRVIVEFFSMTVLVMHVIVMRMGFVPMAMSRQTVPAMRMIS